MNKVKKLKRALCNPEPFRKFLRLLGIPVLPIATLAVLLLAGKWIFPHVLLFVFYAYFAVAIVALVVYRTVLEVRRVAYYRTLKQMGRMSWDYLVNNGLEQEAASEFFGKERVECHLRHKGNTRNPYFHRKNTVTPHFVFIMSDGVVLHHSEIISTQRQRISFMDEDKGNSALRIEFFALGVEDGTNIPLMSMRTLANVNIHSSKDDLSHIKPRDAEKLEAINKMIKAGNPDCKTSLRLAHSTVITG